VNESSCRFPLLILGSPSDSDLERLYEQWEEDEEPLPVDELPDHDPRKPQPAIDFTKLDMSNPENVIKATKKGKTLMLFAKVRGSPSRQETEDISAIWQTGLWNSHIQCERFLLEDDRVIFMFHVSFIDTQRFWLTMTTFVSYRTASTPSRPRTT